MIPVNPILINMHYYFAFLAFQIKEDPWWLAPQSNKYILLLGIPKFPITEGPYTMMVCTPSQRSVDGTTDKEIYIFLEARTNGALLAVLCTWTHRLRESRLSLL
jgi:hypothetical protein